jgi:integrase
VVVVKSQRRAKGEGALVQRSSDGRWLLSIDLGRDAKGARKRRVLYGKTRSEVLRKATDLRARSGGHIRPRASGSVGAWVETWLLEVQSSRTANTYALYESLWRIHAAPRVGNLPLERFDVEHVSALYHALAADGASTSMVGNVGRMMHRAFAVAVKQRVYHRPNPFGIVEKPSHRPKDARALTQEEARRFVEAARGDRFEALWLLLLTTGLRIGEALGLKWGDIDFERKTVSIQRSLTEVGGYVELGPTKTPKSRRLIDLGSLVVCALERRRSASESEEHSSDLVFCTLNGTPMRRSNLRRSHLRPILKAARLGHLRLHDLRHSMGSLAIAQGVPVKVVSDRLGHSTTRMTQDRYLHVLPGLQREAADAIDAALSTKKLAS